MAFRATNNTNLDSTLPRLMMEESLGWCCGRVGPFALRRPYRAHGVVVVVGGGKRSSFTDIRKQKEEKKIITLDATASFVVVSFFFSCSLPLGAAVASLQGEIKYKHLRKERKKDTLNRIGGRSEIK